MDGSQVGSPLDGTHCKVMTLEGMWFPFFFMSAKGFYVKGSGKIRSFTEYMAFRMKMLFSCFTLNKMYIPHMWQLRQCNVIANATGEQVLYQTIHQYKRRHPNATDAEVIKYVAKHRVPASVVGSPQWHGSRLADVLAMVRCWGMPQFFLTLTAGDRDHNGDQWEEVRVVRAIVISQ